MCLAREDELLNGQINKSTRPLGVTVTYGTLVGVLLWIADMVGGQLDRLLV